MIAAAYLITTMPYGRAIHDLFVLLDGSYRISLGQMPHIDFVSPIGPLLLFVMRAGQILSPDGNNFVVYHALMWLLLMPAVAALAPRFASNRAFFAALALLALIMLLPMTLDDTHLSEISYFATYNRFASGYLFLIGLWYVLPKQKLDGALLAYLLFLLFFLKITAALVALGILIAAVILGRACWRVGFTALGLLAAALFILEIATGLTSGYLADIGTMIALNESSGLYALLYYGFNNWIVLAAMGIIVLQAIISFLQERRIASEGLWQALKSFWVREALVVDLVLLVVAAWGAESQNTGGLGLIAGAAILFHPAAWQTYRLLMALLMASMLFPVFDVVVKRSLRAVVREHVAAPVQPLELLAPGTRVPLSTYEGALFFDEIVQEKYEQMRTLQSKRFFLSHDPATTSPAAQLSRAMTMVDAARKFEQKGYRERASRYTSIVFSDPFAHMLNLTPATGTMLTMDVDRTVPRMTPAQVKAYVQNADGVFIFHCDLTEEGLAAVFEPVLAQECEKLPLNNCWSLHVRNEQ